MVEMLIDPEMLVGQTLKVPGATLRYNSYIVSERVNVSSIDILLDILQ